MISNNKLSYLLVDASVWVGDLEYDTRPFVLIPGATPAQHRREFVPVGYSVGYADRRMGPGETVHRGDVRRFIEALQIGTIIVAPEYSGCHYGYSTIYQKTESGWESHRVE